MPDEVQSIRNLIDSETDTTTLIVGTHRPSTGTGHLFFGETVFTEASGGFGVLPFSMLAWHPLLDQATWIYVSDDTQTRRINVSGTNVKVGIPRPNRHGTNNEYVGMITPTITAVTPTTIYSSDGTPADEWFSEVKDYGITASIQTIRAQKPTQVTEGGSNVAVVELSLLNASVPETTQTAAAVHEFSSTLDLDANFSDNSRVEAFVKLSNLASINFIRFTFSMETPQSISSIASDGGLTQITMGANHGYSTGDAVGITGVSDGASANGYYFISVTSGTVFTLDGSTFTGSPSGGSVINFSKNAFYSDITPAALSVSGDLSEDALTKERQSESDTDRLHQEYETLKTFYKSLGHHSWAEAHGSHRGGLRSTNKILDKWAENDEAGFQDFLANYQGDLARNIASDEWFVFSRPKTSFFRSGSNSTKDWSNLTGFSIGAQYNDNAAAGVFPSGDRISFAEVTMVTSDSELNSLLGGQPYDWRYTYYESTTGVESNPSPIMPEGIDVVHQIVTLTVTGIDTTICDKLRIYRRGGVADQWNLVDTINNPGATTTTYVDGKSDLDVLSNQTLQLDNYPPLPIPVEVTQLVKFSERFTASTWVKTGTDVKANVMRSPFGAETGDLLTATSDDGEINQTLSLTTTKETYFSLFVKADSVTGSGPHIKLYNTISATDTEVSITLAKPNYDRDRGQLGVWERFVITCATSTTDIGLKIINNGDKVWIWGAQLESWDADSGFLEPARHVADLRDTSPGEVSVTTRFDGSGVVDDTTNKFITILEDGGPPQIIWGPWQGSVIFGIRGHKGANLVDAGALYWSKPSQPDHWSPFNQLPITHGGDPLQNGFLFNTHSYVFSKEQLYRIDADPTGRQPFVAWRTPTGRGLKFPWAVAVGPKIWFLTDGGIYETTGGAARSITAGSLIRPLFEGQTVNGISGVDLANAADDEMRMEFSGNYLYFMYKNLAGARAVLRWHWILERWEHYTYADPVRMAYKKDGVGDLLYGTNDGFITKSGGAFDDHGTAINGSFRTGALDQGHPGKKKLYGDIHIEALIPTGETVVVTPHLDDELTAESSQNLVGTSARKRYKLSMGTNKTARSISLNFTGVNSTASVACAIHEIGIAFQIEDEDELVWDSFFEDDGSMEDKWITGLYLECNTNGNDKAIAVFVDGAEITSAGSPFTINTNGMKPVKISFTDPVRGTHMRFTSIAVEAKLRDWRWIWKSQPVVLTDPFEWDNLGTNLEKYVKGFTIDADTLNQEVTLKLLTNGDESTNALGSDTFVFTHDGRQQSQFAFDFSGANQILAEVVRLAQTSTKPLQVFNLTWIFDTEPPHKKRWNTQERSFNLPGWGHLRDAYIAIRSAADVTLTVTIDGVAQSGITLSNTSSEREKIYVQFPAYKGKVFRFVLTSASDFKVYNEDTNIWVKPWNTSIGYKQFQLPFEGGTANP